MIGVFDSGYGGLSVLRAIVGAMPQYSYIYYGDNLNAPYGNKSAAEVFDLTWAGVEYLFGQGAQIVILACNTASAITLRKIQQEKLQQYPGKKVLGIVVPTIEQITGVAWQGSMADAEPRYKKVGVLATSATVKSGAYAKEIHKRSPKIHVFSHACEGLVDLIEKEAGKQELRGSIRDCLSQLATQCLLSELDALLLGCTHYALVSTLIKSGLPTTVHVFEQPAIVAASLNKYFERHADLASELAKDGRRVFVTTGDPKLVSSRASRFYGEAIQFEQTKSHS